jgi:hypothetical protein
MSLCLRQSPLSSLVECTYCNGFFRVQACHPAWDQHFAEAAKPDASNVMGMHEDSPGDVLKHDPSARADDYQETKLHGTQRLILSCGQLTSTMFLGRQRQVSLQCSAG